eukprot:TCONS_00025857-protein
MIMDSYHFYLLLLSNAIVHCYQVIDLEQNPTCYQKDDSVYPIYRILKPKEFITVNSDDQFKVEIKMCSTPENGTYCSDLDKSGWLKYGDCITSYDVDQISCDLNTGSNVDWLKQTSKAYFRFFMFNKESLVAITDQFLYPSNEGCFCESPGDYLPTDHSAIRVLALSDDTVDLKLPKSKHMRRGTNARKYDFYFHRDTSVTKVLPSKNIDPLIFLFKNLTRCDKYAFHVVLQPKYLNCRFSNNQKYYFIKTFIFDPDKNCVEEKQGKALKVHLIYAVSIPVILIGLVVIFLCVKRHCQTTAVRRASFDTEAPIYPSPSSEHSQLSKNDRNHIYDHIETKEKQPVDEPIATVHVAVVKTGVQGDPV